MYLGLLNKNENKSNEMLETLQHCNMGYVPKTKEAIIQMISTRSSIKLHLHISSTAVVSDLELNPF